MFANINQVHVREHGMFANMTDLVGVENAPNECFVRRLLGLKLFRQNQQETVRCQMIKTLEGEALEA